MLDLSLDLYNLRRLGTFPRVHGNGFIQIDLDHERRLHIWGHRDIPRQRTPSPIHDHIFGFISHILVGNIANVNYELTPSDKGPWHMYNPVVRNKEDTILEKMDDQRWDTKPLSTTIVDADSSILYGKVYDIAPGVFHETFAPFPAATIIFKDGRTQAQGNDSDQPRVLVPVDDEPDNDFDRYGFDEDMLWDITFEVLKARL